MCIPKIKILKKMKLINILKQILKENKEKTSKNYKDFINNSGDVDLRRTMLTSIPGGIEIEGSLRLGNGFTTLPRNLKIKGDLDVSQSRISKFPNGLEIGGDLDLRHRTNIIDIPKDIVVKGTLFLPQDGFSLAKKYPVETLKKIFPNVKNIEVVSKIREYDLKKPENIYSQGSGPSSLQIKIKRSLVNNFHKEEKDLEGDTFEIDDSEGIPLLLIKSKDGKKIAYVMYDKKTGEFVEGMTNFKYVYKPMSASANIIFKDLKNGNIDKLKKDAEEYKLSEDNAVFGDANYQTGDQYKDIDAKLKSYYEKKSPNHSWEQSKIYFLRLIRDKGIYGGNPDNPKFFDAYVKLVNSVITRGEESLHSSKYN